MNNRGMNNLPNSVAMIVLRDMTGTQLAQLAASSTRYKNMINKNANLRRKVRNNRNLAFFNKAMKLYNNNKDEELEKLEDEFQGDCADIAEKLMINRPKSIEDYDLAVFLTDYYKKYVLTNKKYTIKQALEKFVLDTVYGKKKMNAKFNTKHFETAGYKLAKLKAIKNYLHNPKSNFSNFTFDKLNDPDYYDLRAASNYTNINWYHNSLNNRINKYRRLKNK